MLLLLKTGDIYNLSETEETVWFCLHVFSGPESDRKVCDGTEDLKTLKNSYTDISKLRMISMVYRAVYAIAHAINNAVCKMTNFTIQCDKNFRLESKQVSSDTYLF